MKKNETNQPENSQEPKQEIKLPTAEAIEWENVMGNKSYYIRVSNGVSSHMMNVGKKTFDAVREMSTVKKEG